MRTFVFLFLIFSAAVAHAKALNVEFEFTPFLGDPAKLHRVETVPGYARVFLNNIPVAEDEVEKHEVLVLFEDHEVAPAVWVPIRSLGPMVRQGKNTIRIEFEPADAKLPYRAQLHWATVNDQATSTGGAGRGTTTNQTGEGIDRKQAKGKIVFERDFQADFAADQPWHHYPAITALSDADKQSLAELATKRIALFKPDFAKLYEQLAHQPSFDIASMKKAKCLEKAYSAGVRMVAAPASEVDFAITGGPAVIVQSSKGKLYAAANPANFEKIKGDDAQMCAGIALATVYPPRLVVVHSPSGSWEVVQ